MIRASLAAACIAVLMAGCVPQGPPPTPATGPVIEVASEIPLVSASDIEADRAVAVAIAEHPTLHGYRLVHVSLDDGLAGNFDLDKALQNVKKATGDHRVLGVIGPWNSPVAMSVVPIAAKDNLVMIGPGTTADCLTARPVACFRGPDVPATAGNFFRIAAPDTVGARAAADFAVRQLGVRQFAVLRDDTRYGLSIADAFTAELSAAGGQPVFTSTYSRTGRNYDPLLRAAFAAGALAVYDGGFSGGNACKIRAAMSGIFPADAYFISGDGVVDKDCIKDAGTAADEHLVATISAREPASVPAHLQGFSRGHDYDAYTFASYDCARILIAAIDRAIQDNGGKVPTRQQVINEVAATKDFQGLTGTYSFDSKGDATQPAVSFYYVRGGSWTFWRNAP